MKTVQQILGVLFCSAVLCVPVMMSAQGSTDTHKMQDMGKKAEIAVENLQAQSVEIIATDFKFTPSEFTVPVGRKVKVTLINKSHKAHNIQFDLPDNNKPKLIKDIGFNESGSLEFIAKGPGTYSFKCPVGLHSTMGMKGRMII